jgi:hypothetical protein
MSIQQAFAAGVSPSEFVERHLPRLVTPYLSRFSDFSDVPWPMAVRILGAQGGEWSLLFDEDALEVEEGEGGDEPLVTLIAQAGDWEPVRQQLAAWAVALDRWTQVLAGQAVPQAKRKLTEQRLKQLRKVEGKVQMSTHGVPGASGPLKTVILLNSFDDTGARSLDVDVQHADIVAVLKEELSPQTLMQSGRIRMSGNVALPMKLAGVFMAY